MRRFVLSTSALASVFFAAFLAYTFVAREHFYGLALDYVAAKTVEHAEPVVRLAEEAVASKAAKVLLGDEQLARARREIAAYRDDPKEYIAKLSTNSTKRLYAAGEDGGNPLALKALAWKESVADYYFKTLEALVADLRIFAGANLAACLVALAGAARIGEERLPRLAWLALAMLVAVAFCSYLYVDSMTFFRILARSHMGWWYPVVMGMTTVGVYLDFGRQRQPDVARPF